jgi:hypothetical protein
MGFGVLGRLTDRFTSDSWTVSAIVGIKQPNSQHVLLPFSLALFRNQTNSGQK